MNKDCFTSVAYAVVGEAGYDTDKMTVHEVIELYYKLRDKGKGESNKNQNKTIKNKTFEQQVDEVLDGKFKGSHITMCEETPKILQDIGIPNKPILMTAKHAYLAINKEGKYIGKDDHYHDLGKEIFMLIPKLLQSPMVVFESNKNPNDIVTVLNWYDNNKNILICPLRINGFGRYNEIVVEGNIAKSVYGKENIERYLENNLTMDNVLYIGNKKIRELQNK